MRVKLSLSCFVAFLLFSSAQAFAQASVWRVSHGENVLYLGGTVHVMRNSDYPLPAEFDEAFHQASMLVFETDVAAGQDPALAQTIMQRTTYPAGKQLKDDLQPETYRLLEAFCAKRGYPVVMFQQTRPPMVVLTLAMLELQRLGIAGEGVDAHFYNRAKDANKSIAHLETIEEQLAFIMNLGKGREDDFIRYSLNDLQQLGSVMQEMMSAWRSGDIEKMAAISIEEMQRDFPKVYQQLLVERNLNWMPRIESMLETPDVEFVLVGTLHLAGEDGLLHLLREKGYEIRQQ